MKRKEAFLFLFALLLASSALAQMPSSPGTDDAASIDIARIDVAKSDLPQQVVLARCAYTQTDKVSAGGTNGAKASDPGSPPTLAQMQRQYPGPVAGPPMGGPAYPAMWMSQPSPAHVLIGGAIGFTLGAVAGARANGGVRGAIGIAAMFGLIGAGVGAMTSSFPSRHYYRRRWPDYDEEASRSKRTPAKRELAGRPAARPDPARSTTTAPARSGPLLTATRTP